MRIVLLAALLATAAQAERPADRWHAEGRAIYEKTVSVPTVEGRGRMGELVTYLKGKFEAAGITDIAVKDYDGTQSMIVRWKAAGAPRAKPILLLAHLDVVEARREDWSLEPFALTEKDGYFYGRGTNDNKAGVVAITTALLKLKADGFKPRRDIIVLFTGDEETSGRGADLASTEWRELIDAEYALNSDAGGGAMLADGTLLGFGIQTAEKTYASYHFTARNPGGHSSRPRPDNAIYELASALERLKAHRFAPRLIETTRAYFTERAKQEKGPLGDAMRRWLANEGDGAAADAIEADPTEIGMTRTRCVATMLEGGHAENALPQMARATVNCRILPGDKPADVQAELQKIAGPSITVEPIGTPKPSDASPLRPDVVKAYTEVVRKRFPNAQIIPQMSAGATDGHYFRRAGIPVYGVDGAWIVTPDDERAHGRDERLPVKAFYGDIDHWHDLVKTLAG